MKISTRLLVALAFVLNARAADSAATPQYFTAAGFDWRAVVSPPPADDSVAGRADQEIAAQLDLHRTPEQAALAKHYEKFSVFIMLADVLGDWCTPTSCPRTAAVFKRVFTESRAVVDAAKASWNRQRPYVFNPALRPAVEKPDNASYPSGHAYASALYAVLLTDALPEHATDWEKQAQLVRWSRLVGGAHYPDDVVAGQFLGEAVAREMLKSPQLQHDLEEIRAELRAAIQAHLHQKAA